MRKSSSDAPKSRRPFLRFLFIPRIVLSVVFLMVFAGLLAPSWHTVNSYAQERYQEFQLFAKVLNLVQQYYVEPVDIKKLIYGGIRGVLRELDPHTDFMPPDIYKEFESETTGEFGGLGIEITIQKGVLTIISPIEDTPAWKAGLQAGDMIVEINGESTKGLSLVEAAQKMKGKTGSKIKLGIYREDFERPKVFSVARATVKLKSVKLTDLDDGYVYVRLTSFIENTFDDLKKALQTHESKIKRKLTGLILDLRRNPGGLLDQAVKVSDLFLNEGTIVSTIGRNQKEKETLFAKKAGTLDEFPIVVLIDEYSASASEIVAGALKDNKRALIMGQRSFGKGSVQSVVKLGDGSGLKLTVARYYTPSGKSIQAEGIRPDVVVEALSPEILEQARKPMKDVKREKDIKGHLLGDLEQQEAVKGAKRVPVQFWWMAGDQESSKTNSPKEDLLQKDFQANQAFNYLRTWKLLRESKSLEPQQKEAPSENSNNKTQ